jgi:protein gp37
MATDTSIEWADKTWSPIIGCDRVSPGCASCYAISTARIRESNPHPTIAAAFAGTTQRTDSGIDWSGKVNLLDNRLTEPMRWKKPRKVFVNSLSDLFHKDVPDEFIARVFAAMSLTPQHTFQILTKRHARMRSLLSSPEFEKKVDYELLHYPPFSRPELTGRSWPLPKPGWPLPNVWLGVSVENQKWANIRIPALLETPAAVRFLSCEPLLGPIDLKQAVRTMGSERGHGLTASYVHAGGCCQKFHGIDWVIVGGESGPKARAMHPDWARSLRDQCAAADVPFLFKQWGAWGPAPFIVRVCDPETGWQGADEELAAAKADSEARGATHVHTGNWYEENGERRYHLHEIGHKPWSLERVGLPEGTAAIRRWGKKRAGRELDGRTHDAFPDPR